MERLFSSKKLIPRRGSLIIAGLSLGLAACSGVPAPPPPDKKVATAVSSVTTEATTGINSGLRNRLLGVIDKGLLEEVIGQLPNSLYRRYIEAMGLTFFRENTPSQVAFAGIAMPLYSSRIETERAGTIVYGEARIRNFEAPKALTITKDSTISLPVPFVLEDNKPLLVAEMDIPRNKTFTTGLSPWILIRYPKDQEIDSRLKPILPETLAATIIKEVATIGVIANYIQIMATVVKSNNLEYRVNTKEAGDVEFLSHLYGNTTSRLGRLALLLDWTAFVFMVKAVSRQGQVVEAMRSYPLMTKPVDTILATDFGRRLEDLLPNTFAWCIRNRQLMESVTHRGDFNKVP